ncbi:hypothetical protein V5O48_016225 [Marasmius crinis-equi]|uniref:Terpene synthase n=1 Tax=Marasmius crinis-equi TaxID=585013 RepID=A0ABR3ESD5_9AGAR
MATPLNVRYDLPLVLRDWPWQRRLNPYHETCKGESATWIRSFGAFDQRSQRAFERCDFALLASLAYPLLNKDGNRIGCDLMNFVFVIDEYTDVASAGEARHLCDLIMDGLRNPETPRPTGEWVGGEIARKFWENAIKTGTLSFQRRFLQTFEDYLDGVVEQAIDRNKCRIHDIETYFHIRRKTIGAFPAFAVLEIHMDLPDEVISNPVIERMTVLAVDMIILSNDICSYNVEQARGDDSHNIIRVLMDLHHTDITGALEYVAGLHDRVSHEFLALFSNIPTFGDPKLDVEVSTYVDGLGNWVRANDCWSFESHRYFGNQGLEIQETRVVELLPKVQPQKSKNIGTSVCEGIKATMYYLYNCVFGTSQAREVVPPAASEIVV